MLSLLRYFTHAFVSEENAMEFKLHCFLCYPCIAPSNEYIKTQVENFHLYSLLMEIYAK